MEETIKVLKQLGFNWERKDIGLKFDNGRWNVNVWLRNGDGSRKPAYGFLKFDDVGDAVDAKIALMNA